MICRPVGGRRWSLSWVVGPCNTAKTEDIQDQICVRFRCFSSEMHRALSAWPKYTLNPSFWSDMSKHCGVFLSGPHKGILYYFCLSGPRRRVLYYFLLVRSTPRDSLLFSFTQVHTKWFFTQQHRIFTYQAQNTQQSIPKQTNRKGHQTFLVKKKSCMFS